MKTIKDVYQFLYVSFEENIIGFGRILIRFTANHFNQSFRKNLLSKTLVWIALVLFFDLYLRYMLFIKSNCIYFFNSIQWDECKALEQTHNIFIYRVKKILIKVVTWCLSRINPNCISLYHI